MHRREFTLWLGSAIAALPMIADAQPSKSWRLGILVVGSADSDPLMRALRDGLVRLGYVEGQNVEFDFRSAAGVTSRLPSLATELVDLKVDLIVAFQTPAVTAAKRATADIPIVMGASGDPVGTGLVASLARPGGNVTGMTGVSAEIGGKNLELVREVIPSVRLVGVLANAPDPFHKPFLEALQVSGRTLGIEIKPMLVKAPEQLDDAFAEMKNAGVAALIVQPSLPHARLVALALQHRLPTFAPNADFAVAGGLMSYSADQLELAREAATFVDKILRGRKPADLPVQLATKFQLVINLKTAAALGLTLSPILLARADQVIE